MNDQAPLDDLHSVRFRPKGYPEKALLAPNQQRAFLNFLIRALGENVFIVRTRLGFDIYYLSNENCAYFITKNFWFFQEKNTYQHSFYITERKGAAVLEFFDGAVESLSGHPQLFLSCCKKLIAQFNESGTHTALNKILYTCFDKQLNRLIEEDRVPFAPKIKNLLKKREYDILKTNDAMHSLMQEFPLRNATN